MKAAALSSSGLPVMRPRSSGEARNLMSFRYDVASIAAVVAAALAVAVPPNAAKRNTDAQRAQAPRLIRAGRLQIFMRVYFFLIGKIAGPAGVGRPVTGSLTS